MDVVAIISAAILLLFLAVALLVSRAARRIVEIYTQSREDGE